MKFSHLLPLFFFIHASCYGAMQLHHALVVEKFDEIIIQNDYSQKAITHHNEHLLGYNSVEEIHASMMAPSRMRMGDLPYQSEVNAASHFTDLSPALIHAVIATESGHNHRALSPKGAFGLMQLMPATARSLNVIPSDSAAKHILAGATYLNGLITRFNGNLSLALAAYNAGPSTVEKYNNQIPPYVETQRYVLRVYSRLRIYELQN